MSDDLDYLYDLLPLMHKPLAPHPRNGFAPETIFAKEWERYMETPEPPWLIAPSAKLAVILNPMQAQLTQRMATVAASFVCWLGTNCGNGFLHEARRLSRELRHNGFIAAWAIENQRRRGMSGGFRTLEHILATDESRGTMHRVGVIRLVHSPELTLEDYEVVEHVVAWLGGELDGIQFLERCEARIKRYRDIKLKRDGLKLRRMNKLVVLPS